MWLKILHLIGLTNLSDEQVQEYEARAIQTAAADTKPLEEEVAAKPKADSQAVDANSSEKNKR